MQNIQEKTALGLDANVGALICYVGNLICSLGLVYSIVVLITDKSNKLPRFHAVQSILASILGMVLGVFIGLGSAIGSIIDMQIGFPLVSLLLGLIGLVLGLALLILMVVAAVKAFKGKIYKIPIIGGMADKWSQPA